MKPPLFCTARYMGLAPHDVWPLSGDYFSGEAAVQSMEATFDRCARRVWLRLGDRCRASFFGVFAEPQPDGLGGRAGQSFAAPIFGVRPDHPDPQPGAGGREFAMLDTMSGGRLIAGMMRGTPNEYVTYNINPWNRASVSPRRRNYPPGLDRAAAFRMARPRLPVPHRLDLAAAHPEAASAHVHVGLQPEAGASRRTTISASALPSPRCRSPRKAVQHYRDCARAAEWSPRRRM